MQVAVREHLLSRLLEDACNNSINPLKHVYYYILHLSTHFTIVSAGRAPRPGALGGRPRLVRLRARAPLCSGCPGAWRHAPPLHCPAGSGAAARAPPCTEPERKEYIP
eukprot:4144584-Pyramimonas_sp.AAC.3